MSKSDLTTRQLSMAATLFVAMLFMLIGCTHKNDRLIDEIYPLTENDPDAALARLDSVDPATLSIAERASYDFLTIKARDKAYITHTTDSLVLRVIDYERTHPSRGLYTEALYYGGRVYADLGDYPSALSYFHDALDNLDTDGFPQHLRSRILSQTGRLLTTLRLYNQAIPYIEEVIDISVKEGNVEREVYGLQLLGYIYLRSEEYETAQKIFRKAIDRGGEVDKSIHAVSKMYLAKSKYGLNDMDSALLLIREALPDLDDLDLNTGLANASTIYLKAGINDSAYYYAYQLKDRPDDFNKTTGYHVLLQPSIAKYSSPDSLVAYAQRYAEIIDREYDENRNRLSIEQQAHYNYELQQKARLHAELDRSRLLVGLLILGGLVTVLLLIIVIQKNRSQRRIIELNRTLELVKAFRAETESDRGYASEEDPDGDSEATFHSLNENNLRDKLKNELLNLSEIKVPIAPEILKSELYQTLQNYIAEERAIPDESQLWSDIEGLVLQCSPDFMHRLQLLSRNSLSTAAIHTALLIKCGIPPSRLAILLHVAKPTIASRRNDLSAKLLDTQLTTKEIDNIIRLL